MDMFEDLGVVLAALKVAPGNTVFTVPAGISNYTQYRLDFDDGDVELAEGKWIVGASSGAAGKIVEMHADTATWTNNTGFLYLDSWNGVAFQDNEEIKQADQATAANVNGILRPRTGPYEHKGQPAKAVTIFVLAQTALFNFSGAIPDQTALIGLPIIANATQTIKGAAAIKNMKFVDYTAGQASTVFLTFFY